MKNTIGSPVSDKDFYNRKSELRRTLLLLEEGNSIMYIGIRRTGKSSLLKETARQMRNQGWKVIYVNACTCKNMLQFYQMLYNEMPKSMQDRLKKLLTDTKAIPSRLMDWITDFFDKIKVAGTEVEFNNNWQGYSQTLEKLVGDFLEKENKIVLFIDELPFLFQNMGNNAQAIADIQAFLTTLRAWRDNGIPMGIAGSLNIHLQLDHLGISRKLLTGINAITVNPFNREDARGLINDLLKDRKLEWWNEGVTEKILDLLPDYIPFFLQKSFSEISIEEADTPEKVEEVFHNNIETFLIRDFLYQFEERMNQFKDGDGIIAGKILDTIARHAPANLSQLQSAPDFKYEVLIRLIDLEFLIIDSNGSYQYSLNIIRDWWLKKSKS